MLYNYISPTLLNNWLYLTSCEYADYDKFLSYLNKEEQEETPEMTWGKTFEQECYEGKHEHIQKYIKGGLFQVECAKIYKDILIFGYADVLNYDTIYDIKTTKRYTLGKYFNTSQHLIYPYCLDVKKFKYLIQQGKHFYTEDYNYKEGQAERLIDDFIKWLKVTNLYDIWLNKWKRER